jgi:hypothetical protein
LTAGGHKGWAASDRNRTAESDAVESLLDQLREELDEEDFETILFERPVGAIVATILLDREIEPDWNSVRGLRRKSGLGESTDAAAAPRRLSGIDGDRTSAQGNRVTEMPDPSVADFGFHEAPLHKHSSTRSPGPRPNAQLPSRLAVLKTDHAIKN